MTSPVNKFNEIKDLNHLNEFVQHAQVERGPWGGRFFIEEKSSSQKETNIQDHVRFNQILDKFKELTNETALSREELSLASEILTKIISLKDKPILLEQQNNKIIENLTKIRQFIGNLFYTAVHLGKSREDVIETLKENFHEIKPLISAPHTEDLQDRIPSNEMPMQLAIMDLQEFISEKLNRPIMLTDLRNAYFSDEKIPFKATKFLTSLKEKFKLQDSQVSEYRSLLIEFAKKILNGSDVKAKLLGAEIITEFYGDKLEGLDSDYKNQIIEILNAGL